MALAGPDGHKAEELLRESIRHGTATLGELAGQAVGRLVAKGQGRSTWKVPLSARRLFTAAERKQLAKALAATNATAELLGRYRVRKRLGQVEKHREAGGATKFSDAATDFTAFDDDPLRPMSPRSALDYFCGLIPELGDDVKPAAFADGWERTAFTLAEATEQTVLEKVQAALRDILATGRGSGQGTQIVQELLDEAGISPRNAGYAENVYRTNMMDAYTTGMDRERQNPDVQAMFPVWRYRGIRDGRQRPAHEKHFDRYFPSDASFADVRDSVKGSFDGFQCRCIPQEVDKYEWAELQEKGERVSAFSERFVSRDAEPEKFCQEGQNKGKPGPCPEGQSQTPAPAAPARPPRRSATSPKPRRTWPQRSARRNGARYRRSADASTPEFTPSARPSSTSSRPSFAREIELAAQVAKERGLPEKHVARVGRILAVADWIGSMPAGGTVAGLTGSLGLGKLAANVPLASAAYVAYSGARDPFALIRAAHKVIAGKATRHAEPDQADLVEKLLERASAADMDWYEALVAAGLDQTRNLAEALNLADEARHEKFAETAAVPTTPQQTSFSCGPAALRAVLARYGIHRSEAELRELLHADPDNGTPPDSLAEGARALGLDIEAREGMTLPQLERALIRGWPVIICGQFWGSPEGIAALESGHWTVAIGLDREGIIFADSELDGPLDRGCISRDELLERWRDRDGSGRTWVRFGIVVKGPAE